MDNHPTRPLRDLAQALAFALGWTLQPLTTEEQEELARGGDYCRAHTRAVLARGDGASIQLYASRHEPKITVSGYFPQNYHVRGHSIGVSPDRSIDAIARDIERRLLPGYHAAITDALERQRTDEGKKVAAREAVSRLAAALCTDDPTASDRQRHGSQTYDEWTLYAGHVGRGRWRVSSYHPDEVELQSLSVPLDVAIRIAELLVPPKAARRRA